MAGRSIAQRWQRAQAYLARREPAPARAQLEAMRALDPADVRTRLLASQIAWRDDHIRLASEEALAAFHAVCDDPVLLCDTVDALLQSGEVVAARVCLARLVLATGATSAVLLRLADCRQRLNEHAESLALIERALAAGARDPETLFHYGAQLYFHGRMPEAEAALKACLAAMPEHGQAAFTVSALRTQTTASNHLARLDSALARVAQGSLAHAALEFARYKELEDIGCCDAAWRALAAGNAVMHLRNPFDVDARTAFLDRLIATCSADRLRAADAAPDDGPQPIFVLGLPRSGTTLLDRMLGSHPDVQSAGETIDFATQLQWCADTRHIQGDAFLARLPGLDYAGLGRRYLAQARWRARSKRFFIDKQPPNWEAAGLIHAALPRAKILHLVRDPLDVCFSSWRAFFGDIYPYSYDLAALGAWHQGYRRVMAHWHRVTPGAILDVPYAELAGDPEATLRKVLAWCGLAWHPACVRMEGNATPVMTLSAMQVRGPVRPRAGAWRPYSEHLAPLRVALGRA